MLPSVAGVDFFWNNPLCIDLKLFDLIPDN